jgi:hypothetical protein
MSRIIVPGALNLHIEIEGRPQLDETLRGRMVALRDWRPFFRAFEKDWNATRAAIFRAQGAFEDQPQWADLSENYAKAKARMIGPDAGILVRSGELLGAILRPKEEMTETSLELTVENSYAIYHQSMGFRWSNLPRRPFYDFTDAERGRVMTLLRATVAAAMEIHAPEA